MKKKKVKFSISQSVAKHLTNIIKAVEEMDKRKPFIALIPKDLTIKLPTYES